MSSLVFATIKAQKLLHAYFVILVFLLIAIGFAGTAISLGFICSKGKNKRAKTLPYECGFDSVGDCRKPFANRYYLIAILFLLFDVETMLFLPWAVSLRHIGWLGFSAMLLFISFLLIGFIYEWRVGAFKWE